MNLSLVLRVGSRLIVPLLDVTSLWILLRGHHLPGGGFIGGLVLSASQALSLWAGGPERMRKHLILSPEAWIALGLATALASGLVGLVLGHDFFYGYWPEIEFPLLGRIGTPVTFDLGVYWVVLGVCSLIFLSLKNWEESA